MASSSRSATRLALLVTALFFVLMILIITLSPVRVETALPGLVGEILHSAQTAGWTWLTFSALEQISNMIMFIPVGILAFFLLPRAAWPWSLAVGPVLSTAIECVQYVLLPARSASTQDIILNSTGSWIGIGIAAVLAAVFALQSQVRPSPAP